MLTYLGKYLVRISAIMNPLAKSIRGFFTEKVKSSESSHLNISRGILHPPVIEFNMYNQIFMQKQKVKDLQHKYQFFFLIIGLVNNLVYTLMLSSAQDIAVRFGQQNFMGLIGFALIFPTVGMVLLNSIFLLRIEHKKRVVCALIGSSIACAIYGIFSTFPEKDTYAFYMCIVACFIIGGTQSMGQGVMIAFIKKFPSQCISGWSSGTGFAGLIGAGTYLLFKSFQVSNLIIFLLLIPLLILYGILFFWLDRNKPKQLIQDENNENQARSLNALESDIDSNGYNEKNNLQLNCINIKMMGKKIWFSLLNIGAVFFFQYAIITSFADIINSKSQSSNYFQNHAYQILSFCYQIGVCISRSSLTLFKIKRWTILTIIQMCNFLGWFIFCFTPLNIYIQFVWMVFVGLLGGSSYVNIYYHTLQNNMLAIQQKELAVNMTVLSVDICSTLATVFALILSNSIFKNR